MGLEVWDGSTWVSKSLEVVTGSHTDTFDGSSLDTDYWESGGNQADFLVSGGELTISVDDDFNDGWILARNDTDLVGQWSWKVTNWVETDTTDYFRLEVGFTNSGDEITILLVSDGSMEARTFEDGVLEPHGAVAAAWDTYDWYAIEVTDTEVKFQTSDDGTTWTTRQSTTHEWATTSKVYPLAAIYSDDGDGPTELTIDTYEYVEASRMIMYLHAPYGEAVLADNPQGFWRLDEAASASTAADSSGNDRDASYIGNPTFGVEGINPEGSAVHFDSSGTNTYIDSLQLSEMSQFTLECWLKLDETGSTWAVWGGSNGLDAYIGTGGDPYFWIEDTSGSPVMLASSVDLVAGEWTHVVYLSTGSEAEIYVDGVRTANDSIARKGSQPFRFGLTGGLDYLGTADELAIYDKALTATEIEAHYDAMVASEWKSLT